MTATVEAVIGRPLRQAEQAIDVALLDEALREAKDAVDDAIEAEQVRAGQQWVLLGGRPSMNVTRGMLEPLEQLHELGREEAWNELERAGYTLRRLSIEEIPESPDDLEAYLRRNLTAIEVRIEQDLVRADLSGLAADAIARALLRIPGGRDIASRIVSTALIGGLAQTWDEVDADGLVQGWEITAILDLGTCLPCREHDGLRFETRAQAYAFLPNGGPAVYCLGRGRCRCRLVPLPFGEVP